MGFYKVILNLSLFITRKALGQEAILDSQYHGCCTPNKQAILLLVGEGGPAAAGSDEVSREETSFKNKKGG